MDALRWERIQSLFLAVVDRQADEQAAVLDEACARDADLRHEVEALLRGHRDDQALAIEARLLVDEHDETPEDDPLLGSRIGPYRLLERIGQGGMGNVYLAERDDEQYRQKVAVKLVRPGHWPTDVSRRFRVERQILAGLTHPNIAHLLDGGVTSDGRPYLVMEHIAGAPVTQFCDERHWSIERRLRLFCTVCEAVQFAHRNLVVHRDVKPSNVLVTASGDVKLLDFGIAKLLDPGSSPESAPTTQTAMRVMTPEYAAPEQVRGETITTATDVYALGVLLYELLTGHRPYRFPSNSPVEMERIICGDQPTWPSTVVALEKGMPPSGGHDEMVTPQRVSANRGTEPSRLQRTLRGDLDNIVMMALRKEPARRYASAMQFAEDIGRYLDGRPVIARKDTVGYRTRKFVRRNRTAVTAAAGAFLLISAFGVVMTVLAARISTQAGVIATERDRAQLEAEKATQVAGFLEDLFEAPDPYGPAPDRPDTLPVGTFLVRGADKLRTELEDQPAVKAQLLHVLGRVFRRLGRYEEAQPLLQDAVDLRIALGDDDIGSSLEELGLLQRSKAQFDEARASFRAALDIRRRQDGPGQESEARILFYSAGIEWQAGQYDSAETLAARALDIREHQLSADDPRIGESLRQLGIVHSYLEEWDTVLVYYERSLPILEASYGPDNLTVASMRESLALTLDTMGDTDSALALHQRVLAVRERRLPEHHPSIAYSLHNMGRTLVAQGRSDEALPLYQRAIAIRERALGPDHPQVGYTLESLAILVAQSGDLAGARPYFERAHAVYETALGPDHPETIESLRNLAALAALEGDTDRAIRLLRTAVDRGYADADALDRPGLAALRGIPAFETLRDEVRRRADAGAEARN